MSRRLANITAEFLIGSHSTNALTQTWVPHMKAAPLIFRLPHAQKNHPPHCQMPPFKKEASLTSRSAAVSLGS